MTWEQTCTGSGGTPQTTPCDPTGNVGACESPLAPGVICYYQYYYPPVTTMTAMTVCGASSKNTFHPPN